MWAKPAAASELFDRLFIAVISSGRPVKAHGPLLMGEVSKFARGGKQKSLRGRELGEVDNFKRVSKLIDDPLSACRLA